MTIQEKKLYEIIKSESDQMVRETPRTRKEKTMKKVTAKELEEATFCKVRKGIPASVKKSYRCSDELVEEAKAPSTFTFGRGYFYRTAKVEDFVQATKEKLEAKGFEVEVKASGDNWSPFYTGAETFSAKSSFFWVVASVVRKGKDNA